ncbi:hypothetical protein ABWH88_05275 [Marinobacter adhaerens]|mgnify:CR=1 FL=1|jgi:hypothetical protein|uniref:Uncharacterized protein n=2 Tax=Marinobacter adhaerens TaxID=1033846 RepID=A0ABX8INN5_9GAMM|nr:hypothetical protein [Marinobacter adhaerens]ADP96732.1 hypothetical protein HP15_968 [Marinobacter adhaerens HP15]MBW4979281.1 hypothetical protein [Marinobacter adhaerens]QWV14700.1 hypothetical protein KQ249_08970 [Marinobacter adhaerens]
MSQKKFEWGKEVLQAGNDVAGLAKDVGIPGIGLLARFAQEFYDTHLQRRFERFVSDAEIDEEFIESILDNETYSNCFYAVLEATRQTHSRIGLTALALIYRDHWKDEDYLIAAVQAFSQISDKTILAFIELYESIPSDENWLSLKMKKDEEEQFHDLYNEAVELIRRNFFVMSTYGSMHANAPVQGMKWHHTDSYYSYCVKAKELI